MNLKEARDLIERNEMPASESARLLDQVESSTCIHFRNGECNHIEFCTANEVEPLEE